MFEVKNIITGEVYSCKTQEEFEAYVTSLTPWYDPKKMVKNCSPDDIEKKED